MPHSRKAPWYVRLSAMQREQPISLVRSRSASIEHRVARSRGVVVGDRLTASMAGRVFGVVHLSRGAMTHRGQASWHVRPSAMQREQLISLVRSRSASIEHRVWQARVVASWRSATGPRRARLHACGVVRLSRGAMTHRGQASWHVRPSAM